MTTDTKGFKNLREDIEFHQSNWTLIYNEIPSETGRNAIEKLMIHKLNPLTNDETWQNHLNGITIRMPFDRVVEEFAEAIRYLGFTNEIQTIPWTEYKNVDKKLNGVYIIWDSKLGTIYTGLGIVRDRQLQHYNKSIGKVA